MTTLNLLLRLAIITIFLLGLLSGCESKERFPLPLEGHWIFINQWAAWCEPCRKEVPALNRLATEKSDTVKVYGFNIDELSDEALAKDVAKLNIQFPQLTAAQQAYFAEHKSNGLPTTLVFNPEGKLDQILIGEQTYKQLLAAITK